MVLEQQRYFFIMKNTKNIKKSDTLKDIFAFYTTKKWSDYSETLSKWINFCAEFDRIKK